MRRIPPLLLLALLLLLAQAALAAPQQALQQERRVALVIGNSGYKEQYFGPLPNPANDARDMAAALKKLGFEVIHKQDANKREMEDAIRSLGTQLKKGGVGLFYFAGHGIQYQNRNYLIPLRAGIHGQDDLAYEGVDAERVLSAMSVAENGFNIVILDACRANMNFPGASRSGGAGLAEMKAPTGSLIAYATSPGSYAADGQSKNGTYTESLLRRMATPGLPVEQMFKQVRMDVAKVTKNLQIPWEHSSLMGDFSFAGGEQSASLGPASSFTPYTPTPVAPAPKLARPGSGTVDLSDIDADAQARAKAEAERAKAAAAQAKVEAAARKEWDARLKAMQADFAKVQTVEKSGTYTAEHKAKAWERFAAAYADKNPFTDQDKSLRSKAQVQQAHWEAEARNQADAQAAALAATPKKQPQLLALGTAPKEPPPLAAEPKAGDTWTDPVTGMEFKWVPGGTYEMGCGPWAGSSGLFGDCNSDETPVHMVRLNGFWLGKYEVTQGQWEKVMGNNFSDGQRGNDFPAQNVSWDDAKGYISRLNAQGWTQFRLPTEAEWEYAARSGGRSEKYAGGDDIDRVAWYGSPRGSNRVGTKAPNGLGLYDMSGNVWEWCEDVYDDKAYGSHSRDNPMHGGGSVNRVYRGGSWSTKKLKNMRTSVRGEGTPNYRYSDYGFRLVRIP